jgi:L-glutamine-phosphate cytidylyltransferase
MAAIKPVDRAIILSAGKGSRLLPLTTDRPKCLIELSGRTLLEWQLDTLLTAGISEMVVVAGFGVELVENVLARRCAQRGNVSVIFNPFYHVADNLGSAWTARSAMDRDFLLLNGDTLVPPALVTGLLGAAQKPITLAVDTKEQYDADDMKVLCQGDRLVRVDKGLAAGNYNAEAIGLARFIGHGRTAFRETVEQMMRTPQGTSQFYLRAIDRLADTGIVHAAQIGGQEWVEVDYPADLEIARQLTDRWAAADLLGDGPELAEPFA